MSDTLFADISRFSQTTVFLNEDGVATSYSDLASLADDIVAPLGSIRRLVVLEGSGSLLSIAAYVGCLRAGHVPLLVGANSRHRDARFFDLFEPSHHFRETEEGGRFLHISDRTVALHPDLALLLSSSGSTGNPKLVRLSHGNLGSGLVDHSQKMTVAARAMAEKKAVGQRS